MLWCYLAGANRPPNKQAMPIARQEDLGLCVLWSLSLSLQSVPRSKKVASYFQEEEFIFWYFLVGANRPPKEAIPVASQENFRLLCPLVALSVATVRPAL